MPKATGQARFRKSHRTPSDLKPKPKPTQNQRLAKRRELVAVAAGVPRLLPSVTAVVGPPTVLVRVARHTGAMSVKIRQNQALAVGHLIGIVAWKFPGQRRDAWTDTVTGPTAADRPLDFICAPHSLEIDVIPHVGHVVVSHE